MTAVDLINLSGCKGTYLLPFNGPKLSQTREQNKSTELSHTCAHSDQDGSRAWGHELLQSQVLHSFWCFVLFCFKKKLCNSFEILGDPNLAVNIKFDIIIIWFRRVYPERGRRCLCLNTSVLCVESYMFYEPL